MVLSMVEDKSVFFTAELECKSGITGIPFVRTELFTAWGLLKSENAESKRNQIKMGSSISILFLVAFVFATLARFFHQDCAGHSKCSQIS